MSIVIKNRDAIIEQLADMLYQFDMEHTGYQEDVYLYLDKDGNATLDTFVNVGGNSWRNDNHYTIYRKPEWCNGVIDVAEIFSSIDDLALALGTTPEELINKAAEYFGEDDIDYIGFPEVSQYIVENDYETIEQAYKDSLSDYMCEYIIKAEQIIESFEEEM